MIHVLRLFILNILLLILSCSTPVQEEVLEGTDVIEQSWQLRRIAYYTSNSCNSDLEWQYPASSLDDFPIGLIESENGLDCKNINVFCNNNSSQIKFQKIPK